MSMDHDTRAETPESTPATGGALRHTLMMALMCLPMIALALVLVTTTSVGWGGLIPALGCIAMMGVMMRMGGSHRH